VSEASVENWVESRIRLSSARPRRPHLSVETGYSDIAFLTSIFLKGSFMQTRSSTRSFLARLHNDEQGAEGLEKILIIAAIVLPLLGLLIIFRNKISEWVTDNWNTVKTDADTSNISTPP
jgi:hypothetical protein